MPYHSLLNNDDAGDVDVFEAVSLTCMDCHEETIVRRSDSIGKRIDDAYHTGNCSGAASQVLFRTTSVGWAFAFGSEGFAWNEPCEHYHYKSEAEALDAARDSLQDELNEAALARGFDAEGREVA